MTRPSRARSAALAATAVALFAAATGLLDATPAAAATTTHEEGSGAGFSASWTTRGRVPGAPGNTHQVFVQTFANVGEPIFVDGTVQDLQCRPGQDPEADECESVGLRILTAGRAKVVTDRNLNLSVLTGTVVATEATDDPAPGKTLAIALAVRGTGVTRPHHYLDANDLGDFVYVYEETGIERDGVATGVLGGLVTTKAPATLLRFSWSKDVTGTPGRSTS